MPVNSCINKSATIRVIDLGCNHGQLKKRSGANRFIDFEPGCELGLNPFANIVEGKDAARRGKLKC